MSTDTVMDAVADYTLSGMLVGAWVWAGHLDLHAVLANAGLAAGLVLTVCRIWATLRKP